MDFIFTCCSVAGATSHADTAKVSEPEPPPLLLVLTIIAVSLMLKLLTGAATPPDAFNWMPVELGCIGAPMLQET